MPFTENGVTRIHYEVEGEGEAVVLYHGAGGDFGVWRELGYTKGLSSRYRVVSLDARGHGESEKPHAAAEYEMPLLVGDVLSVLDDLGIEKAHFLGYSMGGRVGFGLAKYAPERLLSLIIGGSHPFRAEPEASQREIEVLERGFPAYVASLEAHGVALDPEVRARMLAMDSEAMLASTRATLADPGYADILASIDLPCLVFVGEKDPNYDGAVECSRYLPNADCIVLPGLSHAEALARTGAVLPQLRAFLEGVGR